MASEETIMSTMHESRKFPPSDSFREKANIKSIEEYDKLYQRSVEQPEEF